MTNEVLAAGARDDELRAILRGARSIALVGVSDNPDRPSYEVMAFLLSRGFAVTGVNPGLAGREILGAPVVAKLADLPAPVTVDDLHAIRRRRAKSSTRRSPCPGARRRSGCRSASSTSRPPRWPGAGRHGP